MHKLINRKVTVVTLAVASVLGSTALFEACQSASSTESSPAQRISNTVTFNGISNSSLGSASLTGPVNPGDGLSVAGLATMSDGYTTDFTSKTHWTEYPEYSLPPTGGHLRYSAVSGTTTTSTLDISGSSSNYTVQPAFTGQTPYTYTLRVYNGSTLLATETSLGASSGAISITKNPFRSVSKDGAVPQRNWHIWALTQFNVTSSGACEWVVENQETSNSVTTPGNNTYTATKIVMTETITGGSYPYYTFDHIKHYSDVGMMLIDSIAVQ